MKIVFMGTPDFAVPSLRRLIGDGHEILAVYTQPDKPKNRGMKLMPTPVKETALTYGIPVFQPDTLRGGAAEAQLRELAPDLIAVAAYGKILPKTILEIPRHGCINVHASLLPKYRGAAPIQWAVLNGDAETGVTIMQMAEGMDTGDMMKQAAVPIGENETAEELRPRLAALGAALLGQVVGSLERGMVTWTPQNDARATRAPMLTRALSPVDWTKSATAVHNQVRGLLPWPTAAAELGGVKFKLYETRLGGLRTDDAPGTVLQTDKSGIHVACGDGRTVVITQLQAEGGKRMGAADYLRGHPLTF